ncbi:MAG: sulfotransferase family protein, partial [Actinomycetota bacterium]
MTSRRAELQKRARAAYHRVLRAREHRVVILTEPPPPSPYPAIFLVGCTRSGTSLLRRIVDSHSRIACPPESHFLAPLLGVLGDRRSMLGLESMGFTRPVVVERIREVGERFFLEYAASCQKPRWADKTPFYVDHLDELDELFAGDARYVMIYRHGLDVVHSMTQALAGFVQTLPAPDNSGEHRPVRAAAAYWSEKVERMRDFELRHPDRVLHLRYEQLTTSPAEEVGRVFTFLDEEFEPATLDFNATHHDEGLEDGKVRASRSFEPAIGHYRG